MPGSVQNATPAAVLPESLSRGFGHASAFAAGPLLESTEHAAQQVAQTQGQPSNKGKFLWSGVALVAGGAALITLANTALRKDECTDIRSGCLVIGTECIEGTNAAAAWSGLGAGVLGVVLIIKGVSMSFQFGPNSFAYRVQF